MAKKVAPQTADSATPPEFSIVRANIHREVSQAGDFRSIYANDIQVQTSPWDMRLMFGHITGTPTEDNPNVAVTQTGELRISMPLAKRLAIILIGQIETYEKSIGPIPIPND